LVLANEGWEQMMRASTGRRAAVVLVSLVALGLAVFLAWRQGASIDETVAAAAQWPAWLLLLVFLLSLINYFLRFVRWEALIGGVGQNVPRRCHLAIYVAGFSLTLTPAKAGEALRTLYLRPLGVPASHSLACLVVERVLDVMAVAAIASMVINVWPLGWVIVLPSLAATVMLAWLLVWLAGATSSALQPGWIPPRVAALFAPVRSAFSAFGPRTIARAIPLSIVGWGLEAIGLVLLVKYLAPEVSAIVVAGVFGAAVLGGALTFLPGGLGGTELLMIVLLSAVGLSASEAAAATAMCRLATLWFGFFLGLAVLPLLGANRDTVGGT
jgi:uncharacterized membrane protein YbhN (UPF0104 family)